jgi:hypothetical protein
MRGEDLNRAGAVSTLQAMSERALSSGRLLRLLLLALPLVLGTAEGVRAAAPVVVRAGVAPPSIAARIGGRPSLVAPMSSAAVLQSNHLMAGVSARVLYAWAASLTAPDALARASLVPAGSLASLSAPRQSLPPPVHDEATCAFCQAAIFPPCAPQPVAVSLELLGLVRREQAPADAVAPQFTTHRRTSSRAPPSLRSI